MMKDNAEKIFQAATQAPDRIFDLRAVLGGGMTVSFTVADAQAIIGLLVGIATLIYVSLGIYGRVQKIKKGKGVDDA